MENEFDVKEFCKLLGIDDNMAEVSLNVRNELDKIDDLYIFMSIICANIDDWAETRGYDKQEIVKRIKEIIDIV